VNVWFFISVRDGCSNFLVVAHFIMGLPSIRLDAFRTERAGSEIGSGMKQVGSGLNGRRRNGADFRTPVECVTV
jgi:hypothetical protein